MRYADWRRPEHWDQWHDRLEPLGIELREDHTSWVCPSCGKRHTINGDLGAKHLRRMEMALTEVAGVTVGPATLTLMGDEAKAMDGLLKAAEIVFGWKPKGNYTELATAIHTIQGFIIQHMLARLNPAHWRTWYETQEE